jgi:4a-hydroxytetrahydrobiopterin dehydratase
MSLLPDPDITAWLTENRAWQRVGNQLARTFACGDFDGSIRFVNALAPIANDLNHHPDLAISWGSVSVRLSSHDSGGITERDTNLAERLDELASTSGAG